tara:strand:+ start:390 stop:587 length:198 start_codon:yes stop_codon:yes gene_type:complete
MKYNNFEIRGVSVELKINKNISYQDVYSVNISSDYGVPEKEFIDKLLIYLIAEGFVNDESINMSD